MNYSDLHQMLKSCFDFRHQETRLGDGRMTLQLCPFVSRPYPPCPINGEADLEAMIQDRRIEENNTFHYPVFIPRTSSNPTKPIIVLHGLNERSWVKYLPWAYRLSEQTGRAVVLFPIAFHINRSPDQWGNPREMQRPLGERRLNLADNALSSFANVALSSRLSAHPIRFFTSGMQSAYDLVDLISQMQNGEHPLFPKKSRPDFFAYSIGAFLAQILFLANPSSVVGNAKLFLFCGGAYFQEMNGLSKLIMDKEANERLKRYYLQEFKEKLECNLPLQRYLSENPVAKGFWSMVAEENNRAFRSRRFAELSHQITGISLRKDRVIPADAIMKVHGSVELLDFDFDYSHEAPFPLGNPMREEEVNRAFDTVFFKASAFFNAQ